jgi:hypothetical protein
MPGLKQQSASVEHDPGGSLQQVPPLHRPLQQTAGAAQAALAARSTFPRCSYDRIVAFDHL